MGNKICIESEFQAGFMPNVSGGSGGGFLTVIRAAVARYLTKVFDQFDKAVLEQIRLFNERRKISDDLIEGFESMSFAERDQAKNEIIYRKDAFLELNPIEDYIEQLKEVFDQTGTFLTTADLLAVRPDLEQFFDSEVRQKIDDAVLNYVFNQRKVIEDALENRINNEEKIKDLINSPLAEKLLKKFFEKLDQLPLSDKVLPTPKDLIDVKEIIPKDQQGLKDQQELLEKYDKYALAYVQNTNSMSDASNIFFGTAINLNDNGLTPVIENLDETKNQIENVENVISGVDLNKLLENFTPEEIADSLGISLEELRAIAKELGIDFEKAGDQAKSSLDSLGVFAANIAGNIADTFSDLLFNVFKGNFDSIGDLWKGLLDTMLRTFTDFAAGVLVNPIRVSLEGFLRGSGGGNGKGGGGGVPGLGIFSGIGDLFKEGGSLGFVGDLFREGGALASIGGLFAEGGPLAFIGSIGKVLGPIGAVASLAIGAFSIIKGLLDKSPRLDLDFDQLRDDAGKSLGTAAQVFQFLDEDVFNNEIFSRSVSRQAGLGLGDELPNVIREAIEGQIRAIQDIIFQLPSDLAAQMNESLLNTAVDIESEVKGDRLLEFDEKGKNIKKKFEEFINGDLQARFIFSIREFFVGAFESLGVLGDSAQGFVDQQFEEFQNLSGREAEVFSLEDVRKERSKNIGCYGDDSRLAA